MIQNHVIAPSILSADFARLGEEVKNVLSAGADWIHFDVMDNHYVPNLTFGPPVAAAIKPWCKHEDGSAALMDVHLMVEPVDALAESFIDAGADMITFHPEASKHVDRTVQLVSEAGVKVGLVLNPATPVEILTHMIGKIDMVLLMSVNPGFGGQSFIDSTFAKIQTVRKMIDASGRDIRLQVDGGVKANNIRAIADAGADTFVAGSAIFNEDNYKNVIDTFRQELS